MDGFLAAKVGEVIAEFRLADGWDTGLTRPAVLLHQPANPNSYIITSDSGNNVNEWQPGQIYGPSSLAFAIIGSSSKGRGGSSQAWRRVVTAS